MYEVTSRTIWEHELYSFNIERKDLTLLARANENHLIELE